MRDWPYPPQLLCRIKCLRTRMTGWRATLLFATRIARAAGSRRGRHCQRVAGYCGRAAAWTRWGRSTLAGRPSKAAGRASSKLLAKWSPKKYGDRVENVHTGADGGPIDLNLKVAFVGAKRG